MAPCWQASLLSGCSIDEGFSSGQLFPLELPGFIDRPLLKEVWGLRGAAEPRDMDPHMHLVPTMDVPSLPKSSKKIEKSGVSSDGFSIADTQPMEGGDSASCTPEMRAALEAQHAQSLREHRAQQATRPLAKSAVTARPKPPSIRGGDTFDGMTPFDLVHSDTGQHG